MNIVTPYPTNIPLNTANVATELARRDNQLRDMITKPGANEASASERGIASENDKSKPNQNPNLDPNFRAGPQNQRIEERQQGSQRDNQGQQGQEEQSQNSNPQARKADKAQELEESKKRLAEVEKKLEQLDLKEIRELKSRDTEVRAHENAHAAVGGQYAGSPTYSFKRGPDGRNYAIGGEVKIDTSPVAGDPQATVAKMQQVRAAALAPAEPSGQDRKVAASASQAITKALAEQAQLKAKEAEEKAAEQSATNEQANAAGEANTNETSTNNVSASNEAVDAGNSNAAPSQTSQSAQVVDPFSSDFAADVAANGEANAQTVGNIFGADSASNSQAPFGNDEQINFNRAAAEQRNSQQADEVVARASRIQNFYAAATRPRESGFSQFA